MILVEFHNIWQLCACSDIMHGTFEIGTKFHSVILHFNKYVVHPILHNLSEDCVCLSELTVGCMFYWYTQCLSFICWLCLLFRNELDENNIWRWDSNEVVSKLRVHVVFILCVQDLNRNPCLLTIVSEK